MVVWQRPSDPPTVDATFIGNPEMYAFLEAEGIGYTKRRSDSEVIPQFLNSHRMRDDATPLGSPHMLFRKIKYSYNCMSGRRRSARMEPISNKPIEPMNGTVQLCVTSIT
jgi:hypothetical protein